MKSGRICKISVYICIFFITGIMVQGACASHTAFDKCCIKGSGGSYAEIQYLLMDFELKGGPDSIIISKDGISEYSGNCSRYSFLTRSDVVLKKALPAVESCGLFHPKGPFISLGYDNKMMIWAGIDYDESACRDKIWEMYEIIKNCALKEGYNDTSVIFNREFIILS